MRTHEPWDEGYLAAQVASQKRFAWDLERDFDWNTGIDLGKPCLPLDDDAITFPGASAEQRLALSQFFGLLVNGAIAEMEAVILRLKEAAWASPLRRFPVNPEMEELGELFFEEEIKHARAFFRYNDRFCDQMGIDREAMDTLLPKAWGSRFLKSVVENAKSGGTAFWWVVATVEEVSVEIYKELEKCREAADPLYFTIHKKHLEEEARHRNYAFLMLEVCERAQSSFARRIRARTDLVLAQACSTTWGLAQLQKATRVKRLEGEHPFFDVLSTCLPLLERLSWREIFGRLFISAPYFSVMLNTNFHGQTMRAATDRRVLKLPFPKRDSKRARA